MAMKISHKSKIKQGRGTGQGADYKPYIKYNEPRGKGTAIAFPDWKNGRTINLLSLGELGWYIKLRWNDDVVDIQEQYPMQMEIVRAIAQEFGYRMPRLENQMTTDLLVSYKDGHQEAYSVKLAPKVLSKSEQRRYDLEKLYWQALNIPWKQVYRTELNETEIMNIRDVVSCYDINRVVDEFGYVRHLIATKRIEVNLAKEIDYRSLINSLKENA